MLQALVLKGVKKVNIYLRFKDLCYKSCLYESVQLCKNKQSLNFLTAFHFQKYSISSKRKKFVETLLQSI